MNLVTLLRNSIRPGYASVLTDKVVSRVVERRGSTHVDTERDIAARAVTTGDFARNLSTALWDESTIFQDEFKYFAEAQLSRLAVKLGGGGHYPLLYFLTRLRSPRFVVETGVAAGFSSAAILTALRRNGSGRLWSSDFPYFRLDQPAQYVGCLVEELLREDWRLLLEGDRTNLPIIARELPRIDLLHYDSDKSARGRRFAMEILLPLISRDGLVLLDDIQDNNFFDEMVAKHGWSHSILSFEGKYVGLTGPGAADVVR